MLCWGASSTELTMGGHKTPCDETFMKEKKYQTNLTKKSQLQLRKAKTQHSILVRSGCQLHFH